VSAHILVVDDDIAIRETCEAQLSLEGYQVTTASSAERALESLASRPPDLLIVDVGLQGRSGLWLLSEIRARGLATPVIVITGHDGMESAVAAMREGAQDYLAKPLDLEELLRAISRWLGANAGAPPVASGGVSMLGREPVMLEVFKTIGVLARSVTLVLIRGETGTGKELVARAIHNASARAGRPFVSVNCSALPDPLLGSELFGHERGAFTGAVASRRGRFELAEGGTLLLDEIGDTSLELQATLLRVLDDGAFFRLGSEQSRAADVRVLAATHRDLESQVADGTFREDLYYRLRAVELVVPTLRARPGDLDALIGHFIGMACDETGLPLPTLTANARAALHAHPWPGNVRELRQTLLRAVVAARGGRVDAADLRLTRASGRTPRQGKRPESLDAAVAAHVQGVLERTGGNKRKAAKILGISRPRLDRIIAAQAPTVPGKGMA